MKFSKVHVPFLLTSLAFAFTCGAASVPSAFAQKSRKAHKHGHAKLNLIVEGSTLTAQFESPTEALYGFEHDAKSLLEAFGVAVPQGCWVGAGGRVDGCATHEPIARQVFRPTSKNRACRTSEKC